MLDHVHYLNICTSSFHCVVKTEKNSTQQLQASYFNQLMLQKPLIKFTTED
jgi:hypothetical protein